MFRKGPQVRTLVAEDIPPQPLSLPVAALTNDGAAPAATSPLSQSVSDWHKIGSDASSSASESDDLVYHFRQTGMPDYKKWAKVLYKGGYGNMDLLQDADLDALQEEFKIPSGVKAMMETAIASMGSGETGMPEGDLDSAAPVQASSPDWNFWVKVGLGVGLTAVGLALGGGAIFLAGRAAGTAAVAAATAETTAGAAAVAGAAGSTAAAA
eukprot:4812299-Amphidinium_carterae.1